MRWSTMSGWGVALAVFAGFAQGQVVLSPDVGGVYAESEPNESKAAANVIESLDDGQIIRGVTRGTSTAAGETSVDYFHLKTAQAPLGLYRHRLVTTSAIAGHTTQIRGLSQFAGTITEGSDALVQASSATTTPARMNQWYGFGRAEEVYYRVQGTTATTANYESTYSRVLVQPTVIDGSFAVGSITITTQGQAHNSDSDFWIYDGNLNPIPGLGIDDAPGVTGGPGTVTGTFAQGEYYLALSNYNFMNNQASTYPTEGFADGSVLDFADIAANSSSSTGMNLAFAIQADGEPARQFTATKAEPYEILWFNFIVGTITPVCIADVDDGSATGTPDGAVTIDDLLYYLGVFQQGDVAADVDDGSGTATPDGAVTIDDLLYYLARFQAGC
ncbi:MAG: GC-type dockerin domain-anchored protein [Phycisphaerales bacterium]